MRGPTSSTAISICCCSPRSIARCSGSVRLHGGTSPGWRNLPRSSATKSARSRRGQAVLRRDSARSGATRPASAGGYRDGKGLHGAQPSRAHSCRDAAPCEVGLGKAGSGPRHSFCRSSSFLPARSPTAHRWRPRRRTAARRIRPPRRPGRVRFLLFIGPNVDLHHLSGRRRFVRSGQRAAKGPIWPRLRMEPISYAAAAGQITLAVGDEGQPFRAWCFTKTAATSAPSGSPNCRGKAVEADAGLLDSYVGWYQLGPSRVLTVTSDGERLHVQETGRPKFEVAAYGADAFTGNHDDLVIFLRDAKAKVTQVLVQEPVIRSAIGVAGHLGQGKAFRRANSSDELLRLPIVSGSKRRSRAARKRSCEGSRTCNAVLQIMIA